MGRRRTGVLISGSGTNLQALLEATAGADSAAEIVLVISNHADAYGLERARRAGVPTAVIEHSRFTAREGFEAAIDQTLREAGVELVCLAGFMRRLTGAFVAAWHDKLLNIHPSLLPAFRGLRPHERALEAGVRLSGCTVHLVRAEVDAGPILLQGVVPVRPDDTPATLAARVLEVEHVCYPAALELVARGRLRVVGERVAALDAAAEAARLVLHPTLLDQPTISMAAKK
jgi:phosphoribosylglycinamide formyltransferase-1